MSEQPHKPKPRQHRRPLTVRAKDRPTLYALLLSKCDSSGGQDSCWNWLGDLDRGYAHLRYMGVTRAVSRLMWRAYHGRLHWRLHVLHTCDNPSCVNPNHLFLGTNLDNVKDKMAKGRGPVGEANPKVRLTEEQVRWVRRKYVRGSSRYGTYALARALGVSRLTIKDVIRGVTWKHIL